MAFRIDDAPPSPSLAINTGIAAARGALIGVMVDGARMVSPGLLKHALLAARLHPRPVIATLGFRLGPDVQRRAIRAGYDRDAEDALLEGVDWTKDGYRLFEISVFAGSSKQGWFAPFTEGNALFMPSELWSELGGYDERFESLGGGFVNVDTFARACALPDAQLIALLGEGTFHQIHGGVATNSPTLRRQEFAEEYRTLTGRELEAAAGGAAATWVRSRRTSRSRSEDPPRAAGARARPGRATLHETVDEVAPQPRRDRGEAGAPSGAKPQAGPAAGRQRAWVCQVRRKPRALGARSTAVSRPC